ncbi:hypothetical protein FRC01_000910 [Tulasnella sp. 417]|nr:hypothetical protein FRC01_000910 [Tulasnella sp. 417]
MHNGQNSARSNRAQTPEPICAPSEGSGTSCPNATVTSPPIKIPDSLTLLPSAKVCQEDPSPRGRNTSTVFDHLPVELALCILKHCFPDEPSPCRPLEDVTNIYSIRLVSRWWKELIEENPVFWCHISTAYPTQVNQDSLRRSKDHPLNIHASQASGETTEACEDLLRLVQTQSHRWLSLEVVMNDPLPEALALSILCSPAPHLQNLTVSLPASQFTYHPLVNLTSGTAHHLKSLRLFGVPIAWDFGLVAGLELLHYVDNHDHFLPDAVELLTRTPLLRHLVLSLDEGEELNNAGPVSPRASIHSLVTAPSLEILDLNFLPLPTSIQILTSVLMPACRRLSLAFRPGSFADLLEIEEALDQFLPKIRQTVRSSIDTTVVVYCYGSYQWTASNSSSKDVFDLSFTVFELPMDHFLKWITRISNGDKLSLRVVMGTMDLTAWDALARCEDVTELIPMFDDREGELSTFLKSLSNPVRGSEGQLTWCFPGLRKLRLEFAPGDLLDVFSMLNKRYVPVTTPGYTLVGTTSSTLDIPPKLQLWMGETANGAITRALRKHWAVESLTTTREIE